MSKHAAATRKLDRLLEKMHRSRHGGAMLMSLAVPKLGFSWSGTPDGTADDPLFRLASCSKLFTATLVFQLVEQGMLDLDAPVQNRLSDDLSGIHVLGGTDHSATITARHLLSNTSGLVNYAEEAGKGETPLLTRLAQGDDFSFTFQDILNGLRGELKPHFVPGAPGRAHYCDTNFKILERLIEQVMGLPFHECVAEKIVKPLGLRNTFVFTEALASRYKQITSVWANDRRLHIPKAMACFGGQGGIMSTMTDCQVFLQALIQGRLFNADWVSPKQDWKRIFFPFHYGLGMMRVSANPILGVVGGPPHLIGHSGSSGVLMFHDPKSGAYICGTSDHVLPQGLPYRFMVPAILAARSIAA